MIKISAVNHKHTFQIFNDPLSYLPWIIFPLISHSFSGKGPHGQEKMEGEFSFNFFLNGPWEKLFQ